MKTCNGGIFLENEISCFFSNLGTRNDVRKRVVCKFIEEEPGQGNGELASRYDYIVESLMDDRKIVLTRPANLKNGFDFLIRVKGTNFNEGGRLRDYPKHDDILNDLKLKKNQNVDLYRLLFSRIQLIHECNEINEKWFDELDFEIGYASDLILKTLKWFFIEQDIRYWNYSGRNMLFESIPK